MKIKAVNKTLDDLQASLDYPPNEHKDEHKDEHKSVNIVIWIEDGHHMLPSPDCIAMNPKSCPRGHVIRDVWGGCLFCGNWYGQLKGENLNRNKFRRRDVPYYWVKGDLD